MENNSFLWNAFINTGCIKAYLVYKNAEKRAGMRSEEARWQPSAPKVS